MTACASIVPQKVMRDSTVTCHLVQHQARVADKVTHRASTHLVLICCCIVCAAVPVFALALCLLLFLALCEAVRVSRGVLLEDAHSKVGIRLAPLL